jgi:hypothetical protein
MLELGDRLTFVPYFLRLAESVATTTITALSAEEFRKRVVEWVVCGDHPFSVVEEPGFHLLFQPGTIVPSANTIKHEVMRRYREKMVHIGNRLRHVTSKISITLECWTSPNGLTFMGITVHYIDDDWAPKSFVLDFVPLPDRHTGKALCEALVATCDRFGIFPKILGIATDNASNINNLLIRFQRACRRRGVRFIKGEQHVMCMAHIVNLAVQELLHKLTAVAPDDEDDDDDSCLDGDSEEEDGHDGDSEEEDDFCFDGDSEELPLPVDDSSRNDDSPLPVDDSSRNDDSPKQWACFAKLRSLMEIHLSVKYRTALINQFIACGVQPKRLVHDTPTLWNSMYAMIKHACELRTPLSNVVWMNQPHLPELSDEEWRLLEVAAEPLGAFDMVTQRLSAADYPTLNMAVPAYNFLFNRLEDLRDACDGKAHHRGKTVITERGAPVLATNDDVLISAIQAASDKLRDFYRKTWDGMYAISVILDPRLKTTYYEENDWEPEMIAHAKRALMQAMEEYGTPEPQSYHAAIAVQGMPFNGAYGSAFFPCAKRRYLERGSEMERYLMEPVVDPHVDILAWWKGHTDAYPCLSRIARDYLAIPATSVPAERVFSGGDDPITKKRGLLKEDTIRACMCLGSWLL